MQRRVPERNDRADRLRQPHGISPLRQSATCRKQRIAKCRWQRIAGFDFDFAATPINEALVGEVATGSFLTSRRNAVMVGGTGTGNPHLATSVGRA